MINYVEVYDDIQGLFDRIIESFGISDYVTVKVVADDKMKKIGKMIKGTPIMKHETGIDAHIVINQSIFHKLEENQQRIIAEELLCPIGYDDVKGKVVYSTPDVKTYSLLLSKFGYDNYHRTQESIKTLYYAAENPDA